MLLWILLLISTEVSDGVSGGESFAKYRAYEFSQPANLKVQEELRDGRVLLNLPFPEKERSYPHTDFSQPTLDKAWITSWCLFWLLAFLAIIKKSQSVAVLSLPLLILAGYLSPYVLFVEVDKWGTPYLGDFLQRHKVSAVVLNPETKVHSARKVDSHTVFILSEGQEILVETEESDWGKVTSENGRVGWVKLDNLFLVGRDLWKQE